MDRKILFVDDCSTTLLMEHMLSAQRPDYSLIMARNGQEAIQKAMAERPRLILMDAVAANIAACYEIRRHQSLERVPIFLVSNGGGSLNLETSLAGARNGDSHKPFNWRELVEMVNTYLAAQGTSR